MADAHEGAPRINVVLPAIDLLVILESEKDLSVFGFEQETVWFEICSLHV
jgi:hypothetical protein